MAIAAFVTGDVFPVDGSVGIDFTQVDTDPKYNVTGAAVQTNKGPAIYAKVGTGDVIAGSYCGLSQVVATGIVTATEETTTTSGAAPRKGAIAISPATAGKYAWFLTGPFDKVPVDLANSVASLAAATTTATAGQLGAGGDTVNGLYLLEASGASGLTACAAIQPLGTNN